MQRLTSYHEETECVPLLFVTCFCSVAPLVGACWVDAARLWRGAHSASEVGIAHTPAAAMELHAEKRTERDGEMPTERERQREKRGGGQAGGERAS